jgi:hypothetical protein
VQPSVDLAEQLIWRSIQRHANAVVVAIEDTAIIELADIERRAKAMIEGVKVIRETRVTTPAICPTFGEPCINHHSLDGHAAAAAGKERRTMAAGIVVERDAGTDDDFHPIA